MKTVKRKKTYLQNVIIAGNYITRPLPQLFPYQVLMHFINKTSTDDTVPHLFCFLEQSTIVVIITISATPPMTEPATIPAILPEKMTKMFWFFLNQRLFRENIHFTRYFTSQIHIQTGEYMQQMSQTGTLTLFMSLNHQAAMTSQQHTQQVA